MRICVVGLGKLGLPVASAFKSQGFDVVGVDTNESRIEQLKSMNVYKDEPNVHLEGIEFKTQVPYNCGEAFICVPTPSRPDGSFDDKCVREAVSSLKDTPSPIVIVSTLMPGQSSKIAEDFKTALCYSPTFIALGSVVKDFLNPDVRIIGENTKEAGDSLLRIYDKLPYAPVKRMSLESAEIAKLATNCFVTTKIAYANQLQMLCEATPNADVDDVTEAMGMDSRIGPKSLKAGMPFGGPCFPRDTLALFSMGSSISYTSFESNCDHTRWLGTQIPKGSILTLGAGYKSGTSITEEAPSKAFSGIGTVSDNLVDLKNRDVIVICTQDPRWLQGDYSDKVVFDPWGYFKEHGVVCKQLITPGRRR